MTPTTLVYSYFNNAGMLERHCAEWAQYDQATKAQMRAVVVDDGSDQSPAAAHVSDPGFPVEVYRIVPNLIWNVAGARNLGMTQAPDGWCLLTDIDHLLKAADAKKMLAMPRIHGRHYVPGRIWADGTALHPHPNTYVIERATYWKTGGCDEDWTGYWGAGEGVFRKMLKTISPGMSVEHVFRLTHFGRDDVPDSSTVAWGRRNSDWDWSKNPKLVKKAKGPAYKPVNPLRFAWERVA